MKECAFSLSILLVLSCSRRVEQPQPRSEPSEQKLVGAHERQTDISKPRIVLNEACSEGESPEPAQAPHSWTLVAFPELYDHFYLIVGASRNGSVVVHRFGSDGGAVLVSGQSHYDAGSGTLVVETTAPSENFSKIKFHGHINANGTVSLGRVTESGIITLFGDATVRQYETSLAFEESETWFGRVKRLGSCARSALARLK